MKKKFTLTAILFIFVSMKMTFVCASSISFIEEESSNQEFLIEKIQNFITEQFPQETPSKQSAVTENDELNTLTNIAISFGFKALQQALENKQHISIATVLTQAEVIRISRNYPQQLTDTQFVLSQPTYQCQLDLFKKISSKSEQPQSMGVLLKRETRALLPKIKAYAKKIGVSVSPWQIYVNESISLGFNHLMKKHSAIMLVASPIFNNAPQLPAILQQAKILKRTVIASSPEQILLGVTTGCVIKAEHINQSLRLIIQQQLQQKELPNNTADVDIPGFHITIPKITIINN